MSLGDPSEAKAALEYERGISKLLKTQNAQLTGENKRLTAENERLMKAGRKLTKRLKHWSNHPYDGGCPSGNCTKDCPRCEARNAFYLGEESR